MLNLKKVIASICVLAMVLSTVAFGATYTDVAEDSAYYEAVETLNKLEIIEGYEDGTFKPEDGVTRAEMAALIARIQGYGATASGSANTEFADVPASHWASGYVANASGLGIINGYGDGTFGPDDPVLYEQAVKMIMATLGYTPFAKENGGYPAGYLAAANRYNVTANVSGGAIGQAACRGTIAQLLVNALDTPLMIQSKWNTNGEVEYEIAEGKYDAATGTTKGYKTLMSENLGFVKIRGTVEENSFTDVDNASKSIDTTKEAEVAIFVNDCYDTENDDYLDYYGRGGEDYFFVGGTDAEEFLGQAIVAYVKASDSASEKFEIASIAADSSRNNTLTIALDQFVNYNNGEIEYYKDGASKTSFAKTEGNIDLVFNNVGGYTVSALNAKVGANCTYGGQITLIDNDEVKGYDVAVCDLAATAVVKKVTANSIALYNNAAIGGGAGTKTIYVYPEDETKVVTIYKDGEVIDFTDLNEWDVLSVYADNRNADVIVAEVVANELVGTVGATKTSKTSNGNVAYKVGDVWYDVANGAYNEGLDAGVGGKFYIDQFGKIAAFVEDAALAGGLTGNYGYIIAVAADEADFGATGCVVKVQILTADGIEVLEVKNNAKLNKTGVGTVATLNVNDWTYVNANSVTGTDSANFTALNATEGTVVKYIKDANGYLASVTQQGFTKTSNVDADFTTSTILGKITYDADNNKFTSDGDDSTVTPEVYTDADRGGYIDAEATVYIKGASIDQYTIATAADLADKVQYKVLAAYATKNATDADIIVIDYNSFAGTSVTSNVAVITGISTASDEDGLAVYAVTYLQDGEEKTVNTTAEIKDEVDGWLTVGDVVKVKTTGDVISKITKVFDFAETVRPALASAGAVNLTAAGSAGNNEVFVGGAVTGYKESSEEVQIGGNWYKLSRGVNFYEINNNGRDLAVTAEGGATFVSLSEALYDGTIANVTIKNSKNDVLEANISEATAQTKYADYVYIRTYEDKVIDVIVVKGYDVIVE